MNKDQMLSELTGQDSEYWVRYTQMLILKHVDIGHDSDMTHPECDWAGWISDLADEIENKYNNIERVRLQDGNIACSFALSLVLTIWSMRCARAKTHDPNRPVNLRRRSARRIRKMAMAFMDAIFDETHDEKYFPQEWDYPFGKNAKSGDFV